MTVPPDQPSQRPRKRAFVRRFGLLVALALAALAIPASASADVQTYTQRIGPISVGGYEVQQAFLAAPHQKVDGAITHMDVDIVDENGNQVPIQRLMLHHIVFVNAFRDDATCDKFTYFNNSTTVPAGERFYAAGEERAKMNLPGGYGYRLRQNDPWIALYMVMNHRPTADKAYIQYTYTVDTDPSITYVKPYWFDVQNCLSDPIFNVPGTDKKGSTFTRSADFVMPESGRIIAGGGHVHGGARELTLTEPDCGDRPIAESLPTWGLPDHPFYNVRPVLHEPGPINMTAFGTGQGIPVASGERLRLNALYDNSLPHVRVMGIMIVYLAPDPNVGHCGPLPTDTVIQGTSQPGRPGPIRWRIPLTGLDAGGNAVTIKKPPGRTVRVRAGTKITVDDRFFSRRNVSIRRGARLNWDFVGSELHNVTLANGPQAIGSPNLDADRIFTKRFGHAGTYRLFCALHPVQMQERVVVRPRHKRKHRH